MKLIFQFLFFLMFSAGLLAQEGTGLLRFPTIFGDQIVFTYAGDLYSVSSEGGTARRLTSDEGYEMFARFSPDGQTIAFTGQYDGNTEVYTIPARGGVPKRLTHTATLGRDDIADRMGPNNIVMAWTPDGKGITYRSRSVSFNSFIGQLFSVPQEGGLSEQLPLPSGGFCSYSPDGKKLAYNRIFREFRTWKYYRGGMADEIWIHDFETRETVNITENEVQDIIPMWHGDDIYFLSDRDRTMNLFVYHTRTGETEKLTDFTKYDIKFPSLGKEYIVFENGGYLYKFHLASGDYEQVPVYIHNDQLFARNEFKDASKFIRDRDLSPDGERALLSARGEIFTLPAENGFTRNLTSTPGVHEREAVWSPDGKYIAYLSDQTGEYEICMQKHDGSGEPVQLTSGNQNYMYSIKWSPDSKNILWSDRKFRLRYVHIEDKKVTLVRQGELGELRDYDWSPDSKWIVFTDTEKNGFDAVYLYNLESGKITPVTDGFYDSDNVAFSPDGKYLYFSSSRNFNPVYSNTEWNHAYVNMEKIYLVTLSEEIPNPFAPENDDIEKKEDKKGEKDTDSKVTRIDLEGIGERILALPVEDGNYFSLQPAKDKIYYLYMATGGNGFQAKVFDLKKKKETELGQNIQFRLSANQSKMLVKKGDQYAIIDAPSGSISMDKPMDLSEMKVHVDYQKEWAQIFDESWRQLRDFFYVENMHGLDWEAMKQKYQPLVPHIAHRNDLTYVIGEMIGELNVGHAYVLSGEDRPSPERVKAGLLGADISKDASGYFKVDKILKGANWDKKLRSPLTEVGVNVKENHYILAVNGNSTKEVKDLYSMLVDKAGKKVELRVNSKPSLSGSRKVLVVPIDDEAQLYYYNWVQNNINTVNEKTGGQIGYIHIPDMGPTGLNIFAEYFYPQLLDKKGMIIDDRGNGGGNVSPMIIERLRRVMTHAQMMRGIDMGFPVPNEMVLGPKVLLINYASASDGDLFPYQFKKLDLGTIIGTRTWGGVVGIRGSLPFIDSGSLNKPEFAHYASGESAWIIEGVGVEPDIVIDNDPAREYQGIDDQLNKAIEVILEQLDEQYTPVPPIPEAPDKSK